MNRLREPLRLLRLEFNYANPLDQERARVLLWMNAAVFGAGVLYLVFELLGTAAPADPAARTLGTEVPLLVAVLLVTNGLIHRLIQTGGLAAANQLFVGILTVVSVVAAIFLRSGNAAITGSLVIFLAVPLVAAGLLIGARGLGATLTFIMVSVVFGGLVQSQDTRPQTLIPANNAEFDMLVVLITLALLGAFLFLFAGALRRTALQALAESSRRAWVADAGVQLGGLDNQEAVLAAGMRLVTESADYLFIQFFRQDDSGRLTRIISAGADRLESYHLALGDNNVITQAAVQKQTIVVSSEDQLDRRRHLLAAARFGVALPVMQGNTLLGVLDVQSADRFTESDLETLGLFAAQLGAAAARARELSGLRSGLREQQELTTRLQTQLFTFRQRERRGIASRWNTYLEGRGRAAVGFDLEGSEQIRPASDLPAELRAILEQGQPSVDAIQGEQVIHVPIRFRDQTLGAMSFTLPPGHQATSRQIETAQVVAERLALALENTRLFEQSQAQAQRERQASQVTGLLLGVTNVPEVLNRAALNFNEAMGAVATRIYLQTELLSEPLAHREDTSS